MRQRRAEILRETGETRIALKLDLDRPGPAAIATPVPFLNHMLAALARHGRLTLEITAQGDVEIDDHHTVEDAGIVLGQALAQAVGDKAGINRFGTAYAPLDEALARVVLDFSGRPFISWNAPLRGPTIGGVRLFHTDLAEEFFRAVVANAQITAHFDLIRSQNDHHAIEALFKAFALALHSATRLGGPPTVIPSTKGVL
ncbi:MAG TPA: imidazoleglycerol-phosphate dehydratase HisB [Chloroflexia bacterium]|nr:imidazoleglycerol-phosphate dehydratase HisB [Chloroflexia bacterium]